MVKLPQKPFVEKPPHVIAHKCASLIASNVTSVLVKGSIDPSDEAVKALRHSRILAALRNINGGNVGKVFRDAEMVTVEEIKMALNLRGYGAGVGEALVLLLGTLQDTDESIPVEMIIEVAEHAYGMLQIFGGLFRMNIKAKRAKLRAKSTKQFCGRDAIGEWQTALSYRVKSKDLHAHAQWILRKFSSFENFYWVFENNVNEWEASRFVLSTCLHLPRLRDQVHSWMLCACDSEVARLLQ